MGKRPAAKGTFPRESGTRVTGIKKGSGRAVRPLESLLLLGRGPSVESDRMREPNGGLSVPRPEVEATLAVKDGEEGQEEFPAWKLKGLIHEEHF